MRLNQVFRNHLAAERMAESEVTALFSKPPGFSECLEPTNQVLLGPKGSGKSIALRWLSFLPDRPAFDRPKFYGFLLPIGRYQFDYFRQEFERTGDHRPFPGYLNFYLLDQLLAEVGRPFWSDKPKFRLPASYANALQAFKPDVPTWDLSPGDLRTVRQIVSDIQVAFVTSIEVGESGPGILASICSLQHTIALLTQFADLIRQACEESRLGLLFDGLDHLGDLGQILAPLLAKDEPHSERIITKAACRILPRYLYSESGIKLEEGRDYSIFSCGAYGDQSQIETHLRRVVENRLVVYADAGPQTPLIESILPSSSEHPNTGFQVLAELSGGNILTFLECCAFALSLEEHRKQDAEINVILPQSQQKAIRHQAENYIMRDLSDQAGNLAPQVRRYLTGCAAAIRKEPADRQGLNVSIDSASFKQEQRTWQELKDTMSVACELRYVHVGPRDFNRVVRREEPFVATEIRLSNLHAPFFDLPLRENEAITVTHSDIINANLGFPHKAAKEQGGLFPDGPYIFVSIPADRWGQDVQTRIRKAIREIERWLGTPHDRENLATITYREVAEKLEGKYVENLLDAIRGATYVVLDVTGGITSGVMVEIGIASGLRKPHALIWLSDKTFDSNGPIAFDPALLPPEIKLTDIKIRYPKGGKGEQFYRWFHRFVHDQNARLSEMCGFQGSGRKCDCNAIKRDPNKVYIRMQPRNVILQEKLVEELQKRQVSTVIAKEYDELTSIQSCRQLREAGAAIFDVSQAGGASKTNRYAGVSDEVLPLLELGYAMGSGLSYHCVYMEDAGPIPSSMLGEKVNSIPIEGMDRNIHQFVDYFVRHRLEQRK